MSEDNDDGTGETSSEETQGMPTDQQQEEWEKGEEESPLDEEAADDDGDEGEDG